MNLSGEGGLNQRTKAVAISVDQSKKYTHDAILGVSFITGTFGGNPGVINATSIRTSEDDDNKAEFKNLSLSANDTFVINEFYNTKLYVKGASKFGGNSDYYFDDDNGSIKTNFSGKYNLFLNKSDEIHTAASKVVRPLYVSLADSSVSWWETNDVFTALYAYVYGGSGQWFTLTSLGSHLYVTDASIDPNVYNRAIVARIDNSVKNNDSSTWWDSGKVYNQTQGDANAPLLPDDTTHDHAYVKRSGDNQPLYIDWWN